MRLIGKLLALPFVLVTGILYLVCKFLVVVSGAVLGILSGIVFLAALALFFVAGAIAPFVTPEMLQDFISCGGVLTIVAGMRVSGIKQYPIANMIPALLLVLPASAIWQTLMV